MLMAHLRGYRVRLHHAILGDKQPGVGNRVVRFLAVLARSTSSSATAVGMLRGQKASRIPTMKSINGLIGRCIVDLPCGLHFEDSSRWNLHQPFLFLVNFWIKCQVRYAPLVKADFIYLSP